MPLTTAPIYSPLGADPDFADLVEWYVAEMPERVVRLQSLFAAAAWDDLRRLAHQIKGAAGSYGFPQLTPLAGRLEHAIVCASPEAQIEADLAELLAICGAIRAGSPDAAIGSR
jgi:HPt (histidine-containing phosphotransfer) domain-containing protein